MLQAAFQVCLYYTQYREGNILLNSKSFHWIYCINIPGQSQQVIALHKAYQAETKLPFSNRDNAEANMKSSLQGKEYCVSRTAAQVDRKQMKMSGEVQGQVAKQLVK